MKRILCGLLSFVLIFTSLQAGTMTAKAADTKEMKIYDLYLGDQTGVNDAGEGDGESGNGGDCVLIESKGQYLLMDIGYYEQTVNYVIPFLQKMGIKKLSIYFSHMHIDHYGGLDTNLTAGLDAIASMKGMVIENLYLPDKSIGKADSDYIQKYQKFIDAYNSYGNTSGKVIRLKVGSSFTIGDASAKVVGPLGTSYSQSKFGEGYQNNMSLVTMITCGKTRYLTAGDIMAEQEELLVAKYKGTSTLKADIMKLSHHGTPQANNEDFISLVKPAYAFAQNSGYTGMLKDGYKWRIMYNAWNTVDRYGMSYLTANEKKNLIFTVTNDVVTMYKGSISTANKLTGWVTLKGGTGLKNDTVVKYYIDKNGKPSTGVTTIDGKKYYFDTCMLRGRYSAKSKKWDPLVGFGKSYRWFNTETGVMATGFQTVNGKKYYYDSKGLRKMGAASWKLVKIKENYYAISKEGVIAQNVWRKFSGKYRYFDKSGKMLIGWATIGKNTYYFDKDGYRTDDQIKKIGKYKYYFQGSGKMICNTFWNIGKYRYSFDKKGRMAIKKFVKSQGNTYYFDANGRMVKNKTLTIKGKKYTFDQWGRMR